ncbi:OTU domain-containing protein [Candidatus Tisiphia endosymbiont of Ceraclea dissimilis]|uniref:OTU domain-containing protein n=1 Tax=Candidatus Tisiphia endosymbiont of Ceraclea dissimilis TaxID=3077928 RepID=UPI003CCAE3D5
MTKKRPQSGSTGESPEAKKQDSKATPPRQGIQERQGADDANKVQIKVYDTIGYGNCFFHAVFGNRTNADHYKTDYARDMRKEWYNFLKQFHSLEDQNMPDELRERLEKIFSSQDLLNKYQNASPINKSTIYRKYLQDIQHNSYYVMFEEIPILASLAKIQIVLNVGNTLDIINPSLELSGNYNTNQTLWGNKKEAIIYHQGIHFSHAEISNGDQAYDTKEIQGMEVHVIKESEQSNSGFDINAESELKCHVDALLSKLFGREISDNKYANITINDPYGNSQITVCRPQIIGKSVEKMHDVTSYMFIRKALKSQIKDVLDGKAYILNNFRDYILAISKQIQGVCLTQDEYNDVKKKILLSKDDEEFFDLSIITKKDNSEIIRYLITNTSVIKKLNELTTKDVEAIGSEYNESAAKENYVTQLQRYIKYVFNNLKQMMLDSLDTCELTAKFIVSIFDPEGYLIEENNILFKQILLYKTVKEARGAYGLPDKLPNKGTVKYINDAEYEKIIGETKGPYIRIIDNKETIVEKSVRALDIIEQLINHSLYQNNNDKTNLLSEYNDNYNRNIRELINEHDESEPEFALQHYNQDLSHENLYKVFHYHAAKALYFICDFQSLGQGNRILVSTQEEGEKTEVVRVHPSATAKGIELYYIIDKSNIQPEKLITQVVAHISILLSPFTSLRSHVSLINDEETLSPIQKIFSAFCELLKEDYNLPNILGQQWFNTIQEQFDAKIINSLNTADLLGNTDVQYDLDF